jgi:dolichyl-phosphate-mannose-protein mannosyltransferase
VTATLEAPESVDNPPAPVAAPPPTRPVPEALAPWHDPRPFVGWALAALTVAVAAVTRLWAVGWPPGKQFDEIYYTTEAQELLRYGYEDNRGYMFIVHPPLGKWLIALNSQLWDPRSADTNTLDWRIAPALAGIISVLLITRIARRMFRSNLFGGIAGLLLALDGLSVVQSRVALLDIFLQTFVLAGFGALVIDRDQLRGRLARLVTAGVDLTDGVPTLGPRPWRLAGGALLGLACGVKWTALSFLILFVLMSLVWDRGALKSAGVRQSWLGAARRSWPGAIGSLVIVPTATYLLCWLGWFAGEYSWSRHYADGHSGSATVRLGPLKIPINWDFLPGGIRSLGSYSLNVYRFDESLNSFHPYRSNPWSWLVLGRPITFYYPSNPQGCGASSCAREILDIGTPLMWWAFLPALIWLAWHWFTTRDWRAAVVWVAMAAGWLVWFQDPKRTMFFFYMTPLVPFLILGLTLALGTMLGPGLTRTSQRAVELGADEVGADERGEDVHGVDVRGRDEDLPQHALVTRPLRSPAERRRLWGLAAISVYLGVVIADFVWMWPLYTGGLMTFSEWQAHMWFTSWI